MRDPFDFVDRILAAAAVSMYGDDPGASASYDAVLSGQTDPYGEWIKHIEPGILERLQGEYCNGKASAEKDTVFLFAADPDCLDPLAVKLCSGVFSSKPDIRLWYADEDIVHTDRTAPQGGTSGKRCLPWFKPEWSPFTLKYYLYTGTFFAVRSSAEEIKGMGISFPDKKSGPENIRVISFDEAGGLDRVYAFLKAFSCGLSEKEVLHTGAVLCHTAYSGSLREDISFSSLPIFKGIYEKACSDQEQNGRDPDRSAFVRVVIPTKDHPELLERVIGTFLSNTDYDRDALEFRITDNGSSEPAAKACADILKKLCGDTGIRYVYDRFERDFNFSYMCNRSAEGLEKGLLLFLNDDVEITEEDPLWLCKMAAQAVEEGVGAVGAKLLYPGADSDGVRLIQHAGITNLDIGPGHKLLRKREDRVYYYGYGTLPMEMLAVTGACLMVDAGRFAKVSGFNEELAVAYNDVELCMKLREAGYRNIQRNDIRLIHHESVSRGNDESGEKRVRRQNEMERLYGLHPAFKGYDPYYSRNLRGDSDAYTINYIYPYEEEDLRSEVKEVSISYVMHRKTGLAKVNTERTGEAPRRVVEGWAFLQGVDNGCFDKKLLLANKDDNNTCYEIIPWIKYRPDVMKTFPDEKRTGLSGFVARWDDATLKKGRYGMYVKYICGRRTFLSDECAEIVIS